MKLLIIILLNVTTGVLHAWSQPQQLVQVKGCIVDKDNQQPLAGATVALLYSKDSTRATSGFTDKSGIFVLEGVKTGNYKLYVTYLGYRPIVRLLQILVADTLIDLETLATQRSGVTLKMVEIVKARSPVVIKKDTMEFNAEFFKIRQNAVIEELLKKLPGLQVENDGTIKFNGETIRRLLIDGKPFFGNDPKIATRNLPADMIDKVQLIDKSGNPSVFTGIESERGKTINITIKKDRKGHFLGRAAIGYGTDNRFASNVNLNRFSDSEQLSFLGSMNNVNNTGFIDGESKGILGNGGGIITNRNGGVNYSRDINDKLKINSSYIINTDKIDNSWDSYRQNMLPDTTYYYNQHGYSQDENTVQTLNVLMEYRPDSMHMLNLTGNFSHVTSNNKQQNQYESLNGKQEMVNAGYLDNVSNATAPNFSTSLVFSKRFHKKGRIFNASFNIRYNSNDQDNINRSNNLFKQPDDVIILDTINQYNNTGSKNNVLNFLLFFAEPIFKDSFLDLYFSYTRDYSSKKKSTYDYNHVKGEYDHFNDSLSNSFNNISKYCHTSIAIRTQKARYKYSIGLNMLLNSLNNNNISQRTHFQNNTTNFYPTATFNYEFVSGSRLDFNYVGNPEQPDILQLQPVPDNKDPLYIQLGNPDLKPGFTHNVMMTYNKLNTTTLRNFTINVTSNFMTNKIINANWFDSLGRQVSQPQNISGAYNINANLLNTFPLKREQTFINANTILELRRDVNYINGVKGSSTNYNISQGFDANYAFGEHLGLSGGASVSYNRVRYDLTKENNTAYFNYNISCSVRGVLPLGFSAGLNLDYILNVGRSEGYNQGATLLNAYISKELFRSKQGVIKLQGFDILNQNLNVRRTVNENFIEDMRTRVLRRFFMLSFSYLLKPKEDGN
ncbi:TonB-dependent receptor [uncultured Chitinophaga sp.]|jgi:hypothetical protein|uniref:TonB-dependent receptor n=1 Tax=uncultured Chitinophaga sp. TaxID=339340 RepID=UPI002609E060|nr:TonB-dependent receptor [uncultured Chitinophaga sp.]